MEKSASYFPLSDQKLLTYKVNSFGLSNEELEIFKEELIFQFELNLHANKKKSPVDLRSDDCFTNIYFVNLLKDFFGTSLYNRYFSHIYYDPKNGTYNDQLFEDTPNNQIILLLGSYTNINSVDNSIKEGKLFNTVRDTIYSEKDDKKNNNVIVGVCFGSHICGVLSGHEVKPSDYHYKNIECELLVDKKTPLFYKKILSGLYKDGESPFFRIPATNRQYLNLKEEGEFYHVLAKDEDGHVAIAGSENEKCILIQPHPEINTTCDEVVEDVHKKLHDLGVESEYKFQSKEKAANIGLSLYIPILLESIKKINSGLINDSVYDPNLKNRLGTNISTGDFDPLDNNIDNNGQVRKVIDILSIKGKINDPEYNIKKFEEATIGNIETILKDNSISLEEKENTKEVFKTRDDFFIHHKEELQELLFKYRLGTLNGDFNWSVSRNILIASEIFGLRDIHLYIHDLKNYLIENGVIDKNDVFVTRELGPGDLSLLKELINKDVENENMLYYGVGDKIYYKSLYNILLENFSDLPVQILKVFTHKFFETFNKLVRLFFDNSSGLNFNLKDIINESIKSIKINKDDKVGKLTMFGYDVKKIGYGDLEGLNPESKIFLKSQGSDLKIEQMKKIFKGDPLKIIDGFFHKMLISDFSNIGNILKEIDPLLAKSHFQFSLRATSHLDSEEYYELLDEVIGNFLSVGGVIVDDGVFGSFTFLNRISELLLLKNKYGDGVNMEVIYDPGTNYISSVIIQKKILGIKENFDNEKHINKGLKLISIQEVNKSSFFKIENFYREFIYNFFDNDKTFFWNFHDDILNLVRFTIKDLKNSKDINIVIGRVKMELLKLISLMCKKSKKEKEFSKSFVKSYIDNYFMLNENFKDIFYNDIYIPSWQNIKSNRKK